MIRPLLAIPAGLCAVLATPALAGDVVVTLDHVRPDAGDLYVALQTEDQFMQREGLTGEIVPDPQERTVTVTLHDVPDGRYSLAVWHDIDGDGTFTMGANRPLDGWAMIGGRALRAKPTFAVNSFLAEGPRTAVAEEMIYPEGGA